MSKIKKGIILALITAFISGCANFISKIGVSVADPFVHTALRVSIAAAALTLLVHLKYGFRSPSALSRPNKLKLILVGLVGGSVPFLLFFVGLTKTSALHAALIHKTLFVWVAFLAILFLGERVTWKQTAGYILVLWANQLLFQGAALRLGSGELLILAATILWAIENIIAKSVLAEVKPLIVAWARLTIGAVLLTLTALLFGKGELFGALTQPQLLTILAGAVTLFFYVVCWYTALSLAPAILVAALLVPATLITNILTDLFVTQTLTGLQIMHGILVILGLSLIVLFARAKRYRFGKIIGEHVGQRSS